MPLDRSIVGRSFRSPRQYEVAREKIREFAEAIGDPSPAYRDPEAARALGHPDVVAPVTFPIVFTLAASQPLFDECGIEPSRLVHGDQRFAYTRPIRPGDRLACTVTVDKLRRMSGNDILTTRTDVTCGGDPVVTTWSTLVVRGEDTDAPGEDTGVPSADAGAPGEPA